MRELSLSEYEERFCDRTESAAGARLFLSEAADFPLPKRKTQSHKYSYGRAVVIAGSTGFSGAPVLAANACEKSGAGLTHLLVPESIYLAAAIGCDGAVVTPLPATEAGCLSPAALPKICQALEKARACVIGPGLGTGEDSEALVLALLQEASCPLVLDADGLSVCAKHLDFLRAYPAPLILTPHEGEFRRLGGDLTGGRLSGVLAFLRECPNAILILKGYGTLVCRAGEVAVNPTGGPAMAKGGSGDVLCGILTALLAQGFDAWFAARCAVYLHGLAGDLAAEALGEYCLAPSDLIRYLPMSFRGICSEGQKHL